MWMPLRQIHRRLLLQVLLSPHRQLKLSDES